MNLKPGLNIDLRHIMRHPVAEGAFSLLSVAMLIVLGTTAVQVERQSARAAAAAAHAATFAFVAPTLEAEAAVVYDIKTKEVLFTKNKDAALPLASLTKLMSASAILARANSDTFVEITEEDLLSAGDSGLVAGERWKLQDLIAFGLIVSSNDAMAAAARTFGTDSIVEQMNAHAQMLGLAHASFKNPTGLDVGPTEAGAYGSAQEIALLAADFLQLYPELFYETIIPRSSFMGAGRQIEVAPTAEPIFDIPGLIGAKTGYTRLSGGNLVALFDLEVGHPVAIVVLGASEDGRFSDVRKLITATRSMLLRN